MHIKKEEQERMAYHRYIFTAPEKEALSSERLDIRLLYISKSRYDRNWQSILHSHAFAELFYVIHGTGVFRQKMILSRL